MPPLGALVRHALGPLEPAAIRVYRNRFIDLDAAAETIASVAPTAMRVLEIGCGDGAMAQALHRYLPEASILGVDPGATEPGRMFVDAPDTVTFGRSTTTQLLDAAEGPFDLVLLVDVVHHVADDARAQILIDAAELTASGGTVIVKEWERRPGVAGRAAFVADRMISGDATVRFMARDELNLLFEKAFSGWDLRCIARVPPRQNNLFVAYRKPA